MIVLLIILLVLLGLMLLRVGCLLEYTDAGLILKLRLGPFYLALPALGGEKKKKPAKTERKKKPEKTAAKEPAKKTSKGGSLTKLLALVKPLLRLFGGLIRKLRIDWLKADLTYGGLNDPAGTAMLYGQTAAGAGVLEPLLHNTFASVGRHELRTQIDFTTAETSVVLKLGFSLRIGQILCFAIRVVALVLPVLLEMMKDKKPIKEDEKNGTASHS